MEQFDKIYEKVISSFRMLSDDVDNLFQQLKQKQKQLKQFISECEPLYQYDDGITQHNLLCKLYFQYAYINACLALHNYAEDETLQEYQKSKLYLDKAEKHALKLIETFQKRDIKEEKKYFNLFNGYYIAGLSNILQCWIGMHFNPAKNLEYLNKAKQYLFNAREYIDKVSSLVHNSDNIKHFYNLKALVNFKLCDVFELKLALDEKNQQEEVMMVIEDLKNFITNTNNEILQIRAYEKIGDLLIYNSNILESTEQTESSLINQSVLINQGVDYYKSAFKKAEDYLNKHKTKLSEKELDILLNTIDNLKQKISRYDNNAYELQKFITNSKQIKRSSFMLYFFFTFVSSLLLWQLLF